MKDFQQIDWDQQIEEDCRELIRLAMREDLADGQDWTTVALVPADCRGTARIVAREAGVVAGLPALQAAIDEMRADLTLTPTCAEGDSIPAETCLATLQGNVRDLLTCERILLNLLGRLIGIATMAREYVEAVAGTPIRVYDTRKTTPGWRRLEKYAVRCGGAHNHRTGLFDAMLIKDNHLAMLATEEKEILSEGQGRGAGWAVECARKFLASNRQGDPSPDCLIEVEVDTLQQLAAVLSVQPDIVLLDNMPPAMLREAVQMRNLQAPQIQLEASGGVSLGTIREIAESGVDRISVGALTHSARSLDVGLDWQKAQNAVETPR